MPLRHLGAVQIAAFSPDGKTVLTVGADQTIRLWDAATAEPLGCPLMHQSGIQAATFSPDGKRLLTQGGDSSARLWDVATGQPMGQPMVQENELHLLAAFSSRSRRIVTVTGAIRQQMRLWDADFPQPLGQSKTLLLDATFQGADRSSQNIVTAVALSPDGKAALTDRQGKSAQLWDPGTGLPLGQPIHHECPAVTVRFGSDGRRLILTQCDGVMCWRDTDSGQPVGQSVRQNKELGPRCYRMTREHCSLSLVSQ